MPKSKHNFLWTIIGHNKKSICLDLEKESGRNTLYKIVAGADVFITNMPFRTRTNLKIDWKDISAANPSIIYASLTGYGEEGTEKFDTAVDATAWWGRSGLMDQVRPSGDSDPAWGVTAMGDNLAALGHYAAIVTALSRRQTDGRGACVSSSLLANGGWQSG